MSSPRSPGLYAGNLPGPSWIDALCAVLTRAQISEFFGGMDDEELDDFYAASDPEGVHQIRKLREAFAAFVEENEKRNGAPRPQIGDRK